MTAGRYQLMLTRRDSYCDGGHLPPLLLTVGGWETCSGPGIILDGGISAHLGFQRRSLGFWMRCLGSRMRCLGSRIICLRFQKKCLGVFGFGREVWAELGGLWAHVQLDNWARIAWLSSFHPITDLWRSPLSDICLWVLRWSQCIKTRITSRSKQKHDYQYKQW